MTATTADTPARTPLGFAASLIVALLLAALADFLFYGAERLGATLGVFALAWTAGLLVASPVANRRGSLVATLVAVLFGLLLIEDPSPLAWALFWTAIASTAILTQIRFDDALRWVQRLLLYLAFGLMGPLAERESFDELPMPRHDSASIGALLKTLALPVLGGALFIGLFAAANPIIANALSSFSVPDPWGVVLHALLWVVAFMAVWPSLRPHPRVGSTELDAGSLDFVPLVPLASILLSLVTFNAVFAVQNALDIAFLWSGAPLPGTLTLADYAHRGVYMLIATALLAGLFVLVVLRPESESARHPLARALVALWVAQNVLLVASSILRTLDYVGAYSLTVLRIWALGWMGLVAVGLALICWRLLFNRSAAWLINANALAAAIALTLAASIDPGAVAANWNVRHAREAGGSGTNIDLCYLRRLGPSAVPALIELETRVQGEPLLLDRVRAVRADAMSDLSAQQADWHGWTFRDARRLAEAQALLGPRPAVAASVSTGRDCDGAPNLPPPTTEETSPPAETPMAPANATEPQPAATVTPTPTPAPTPQHPPRRRHR